MARKTHKVLLEALTVVLMTAGLIGSFVVGHTLGYWEGFGDAQKLCTIPRPSMGKAMVVVFYRLSNGTQEVGSIRFLLIGGENVTLDLRGVVFVKVYIFAQVDTHYSADIYFGRKIYSVSGELSAGNFTALYRFLNNCSTIYTPSGLVDISNKMADKVVISFEEINATVSIVLTP